MGGCQGEEPRARGTGRWGAWWCWPGRIWFRILSPGVSVTVRTASLSHVPDQVGAEESVFRPKLGGLFPTSSLFPGSLKGPPRYCLLTLQMRKQAWRGE